VGLDRSEPQTAKANSFNELLSIISFAFTVGSWGWTVIAPDSSAMFGSALLLLAVLSLLAAVLRGWPLRWPYAAILVIAVLAGFVAFDWYIILKPQRGKEFKAILVDGYHITSECSHIPAQTEMPEWMRDQSKGWQAKVEQLISQKLDYKDLQMWNAAIVVGRVSDVNMNAYQCLWAGNKVGVLETIIASHYDPALKHRDYNGPTYWLNAVNGKVDISDALNSGNGAASVYINGGGTSKDGMITVEGHGIKQPTKP
jgi:hypothetical protein